MLMSMHISCSNAHVDAFSCYNANAMNILSFNVYVDPFLQFHCYFQCVFSALPCATLIGLNFQSIDMML